jgi:arylsulfatase A-like enzyme
MNDSEHAAELRGSAPDPGHHSTSSTSPSGGSAGLRGALVGGIALGAFDALRAWLAIRSVPAEQLLDGAPSGVVELLLGAAASIGVWSVLLVPVGLVGGFLLGRRPVLAAALPLALGLGAAGFWVARQRFQSGLPVGSTPSLLLAAGAMALAAVLALVLARGVRRLPLFPLLAVAAGGGLFGAGWMGTEAARAQSTGELNDRNRDLPNVLFVVVDALRADALHCYGNERARTPAIDGLAERGAVFDHASVQAPYTWTSFGSFFTGKYPRRHGLMKMAPGVALPANVTMASYLDAAVRKDGVAMEPGDVSAGAFLMGALSHGTGLARGFDDICELTRGNDLIRSADRWSQFRAWTILGTIWTKAKAKLDPDLHVTTAKRWLGEHADRRFFAFVHLFSAHTPYDPPEPFRSWYVDPEYDGPIQSFWAEDRRTIERGEYLTTVDDRRQIYDLYMGGVSKADHDIGILLAELERTGVLENTLVVISSDHGEDFGEGGRWEHNHMYRSNLHVPLVISWPAGFEGGVRVSETVESIDVFPTVLDAMGLERPPVTTPQDEVDGATLLPLMRGGSDWERRFTYAEDSSFVSISTREAMLVLDRFAVKPDGWAVALEENLGTVRFHDLETDPMQRNDLFEKIVRTAEAPEAARAEVLALIDELRAELLRWNATMPIDVEAVVRSARDLETEANTKAALAELERLAEFGYTEETFRYRGDELRQRVLELRAERERE